jgi:hypothetical protein
MPSKLFGLLISLPSLDDATSISLTCTPDNPRFADHIKPQTPETTAADKEVLPSKI